MSTRSASASSRSERRPVTSRDPAGNAVVGAVAGRDSVRRRTRRGLHAARDRVREPGRGADVRRGPAPSTSAPCPSRRARPRARRRRARPRPRRVRQPTASSPVGGMATAMPSGVRASTTPSNALGVDGCRAEGLDQRLVVGHEHRPELDGPVESVDVDRPHASAHAIARLDDDDLEARVDEVHRGGQSRHAGADHGDALARLGDAGDLLGGVLPGVARAGERARVAGRARLAGDPEAIADGFRERGAEPRGRADGVERERAAREGIGAPARPPHAVGSGTPSGGAHGRRSSGVGVAAGGRRRGRLAHGGGHVQLASATPAIPESDAARKVRRAMPPDAARESMGLRLADRHGAAGSVAGERVSRRARPGSTGGHACGAERLREPRQASLDRLHRRGERDPEESGRLEHPARAARARPAGRARA